MITIKYLGHQGWCFESGRQRLLMDVVENTMGHGDITIRTFPQRKFSDELYINASALIISHEHADHFDLKLLLKIYEINPEIIILIPDISSGALSGLLEHIGFSVKRYGAFSKVTLGTLQITPLPSLYSRLEQDVYAILVEDLESKDSFFTPIDAIPAKSALDYLKKHCPVRTLDNFTNNFVCRHPKQHDYSVLNKSQNIERMSKSLIEYVEYMNAKNIIISGLGWQYLNKEQNQTMFHTHHAELVEKLGGYVGEVTIKETVYGDVYTLNKGQLSILPARTPVVDHARIYNQEAFENFVPKINDSALEKHKWDRLINWVSHDLALIISLGSKRIHKAIHYLIADGIEETFVIVIKNNGLYHSFSYEFENSKFRFLDSHRDYRLLKDQFVFGLVVNSSDLYGVYIGAEEAHICFEVSAITWNNREDLLEEPVDVDISSVLHPRFRVDLYKKYYIEKLEKIRAGDTA